MKKLLFTALVVSLSVLSFGQSEELSKKLIASYELMNAAEHPEKVDKSKLFREVVLNWNNLSSEAKSYFTLVFQRPSLTDEIIYNSNYFKIHYSTNDATFAIDDTDNNGNEIPDYIDSVAYYLDEIYMKVSELNFTIHPPDGELGGNETYDVYIAQDGTDYYGYVAPDADVDTDALNIIGDNPTSEDIVEVDAVTSYMVLNNDFSNFEEGFRAAMVSTAVHEYMHTIQFSYTSSVGTWLAESHGVWSEVYFYPEITGYFQFNEAFMTPDQALDYNNRDATGDENPWYSQWPFAIYLTEKFGVEIIQDIYLEIIEAAKTEGFEQNDYLEYTYVDKVLKDKGSSLELFYQEYLATMGFTALGIERPPYSFNQGSKYAEAFSEELSNFYEKEVTYLGDIISYNSETESDGKLQRASADYIYLTPSDDIYNVFIEPNNANSGIEALLIMTDNTEHEALTNISENKNNYLFTIDKPGSHGILIISRTDFGTDNLNNETYIVSIGATVNIHEQKNKTTLNIYPNPIQNKATLELRKLNGNDSYTIINSIGKILYSAPINQLESELDFSNYASGFYFIKYSDGVEAEILKVTNN